MVKDTDDHSAECKKEFGPTATVADWTYDLKRLQADKKLDALIKSFYVKPTFNEKYYFVTNENEKSSKGGKRVYFFEDHKGAAPENWVVHDQLGPLTLGSWFGIRGQVMCKFKGTKYRWH